MPTFKDTVQGYDITMDDTCRFVIHWDKSDPGNTSTVDTYDVAVRKIRDYAKQKSKIKMSEKLRAVSINGKRVVLTGVHTSQKRITFKPKEDDFGRENFYPIVPWVEQAIRELKKIKERQKVIEDALETVRIDLGKGSDDWRSIRAADIQDLYERLNSNFVERTKEAKALRTLDRAIRHK